MKILFHVNHLWGIGHFTRTAAIARALVEAGGAATLIAGNDPIVARLDERVRMVVMPAVRSPDTGYKALVDAEGRPVSAAQWQQRRAMIAAVLAEAQPDVLVTETFPFGRRKLADELLHLVAAAKTLGARIVSSVRDIPFIPSGQKRIVECATRLRDHYDAVLIHGDERVFPLADFWPGDLPAAVHHTGFVTAEPELIVAETARRGVVVSAGGGGDAPVLLDAAMAAREQGLLREEPWLFVTGTGAPGTFVAALAERAARLPGVAVERFADDLPVRIGRARLSISRGGSTLVEAVAAATRSVIVPFAADNQPEQAIRAERFAARGLVINLPEEALTPAALADAVQRALAAAPPAPGAIRLGGAARSAALLAQLAGGG